MLPILDTFTDSVHNLYLLFHLRSTPLDDPSEEALQSSMGKYIQIEMR